MFKSRQGRMLHFQPVVLAVIKKGDKYLLTLRIDEHPEHHNLWQLPGGSMEFGETPEMTLHREVREELGVEVEIVKLIPKIDIKVRGKWQGIFISYLCVMKNESSTIVLNEEASEYRWFSPSEIDYAKFPIFEGCVEIIEKVE